ncbi:hypothetical protein [Sphingomonas sanxanigenens]|uniref:Uncharacterized protein n=1 Tax=Sphingomonas sanxanigenens DSM 19645 = NX02 TaxID=1123269 RepID=W0A292_9SPHN|nr:hypothetical protein [Sphingomonas sanxanigenens]AHE52034.1 hypothetical protein NX02_01340 [Sphingomonas sanxanigenens DSM 19645 = NX02]
MTAITNVRRTLFAAFGALFVSTLALSAAVVPAVVPMTAQPVL